MPSLLLAVLLGLQGPDLSAVPTDPLPALEAEVTQVEVEHHVRFLASDELQGRPAVSEHSRRAARYLASVLKESGLKPGAADGTYLQQVPYVRTAFTAAHELRVALEDGTHLDLEMGSEFALRVRGEVSSGTYRAHHVRSAEDVPEPDPGVALVVHGRSSSVRSWVPEYGAGFGLVLVAGGQGLRKPRGLPADSLSPAWTEPEVDLPEEVRVYGDRANGAAQAATSITLTLHGGSEQVSDPNVVARIDGIGTSDNPALADEVIVISAHFDHVGTTKPAEEAAEGEDVIRNGADDDASGVASVLEVAGALAAGPAPARTVLVLLATAEERGIEGTKYFVKSPPVPLERIVCNLNFEMLGRPDPTVGGAGKLWLSGYERSSLGPAFGEQGLDVKPDMRPEQNFFMRSDNIVFVLEGIVGQTLSSYNMHGDYHQVGDDADGIDFDHLTRATRAALEATRMLADGRITPAWNEGEPKGVRR